MNEHSDNKDRTGRAGNDAVASLIARGRPRRSVPSGARDRVHAAVREAWQDATRDQTATGRRHADRSDSRGRTGDRNRVRRWMLPAAMAASLALVGLLVARSPVDTLPSAAPVATVAVLTGELQTADGGSLNAGAAIETGAEVRTGPAGRAALVLADGISVRLDRDTRLILVADERLQLETGAVYVDTDAAATADARVTVVTPYATARDLGTQFDVRVADGSTTVRVREGVVSVSADRLRHVSNAGETARVDRSGDVRTDTVAPDDDSWQWATDIAPPFDVTKGRSLDRFLAWSARELGLELAYLEGADGAAEAITLSGDVAGMTPRDALTAVMATTALDYRIEDGQLRVYRP
jgi:ferric-dicitrate binding protein FerR (iron transport regulator)